MIPINTIIQALEQTALLLEMKGENPFRCRAFHKAAEVLEIHASSFEKLFEEKKLTELPGIGKELERNINDLVLSGSFPLLDDLKKMFPMSLLELVKIPGLGPKKVAYLYLNLAISNLGELEYACKENRLIHLKGFGEKSQSKVAQAIEFLKQNEGKRLLRDAQSLAKALIVEIKKTNPLCRIEMAGELRRMSPVVSRLSFVVTEIPSNAPGVYHGMPVEYFETSPENFSWNLFEKTGSDSHVASVKAALVAQDQLTRANAVQNENQIYELLDHPYILPQCRESALSSMDLNNLSQLVQPDQIKGVFHVHSTYSDGSLSLEELVKEAISRNYEYIGISDHSESAFYAQGLGKEALQKQFTEIERLRKKHPGLRIFWGIESDILKDGTLDYSDEQLDAFDFVIASVHSRFAQSAQEMTQRCKKALLHKRTTMLGHVTGRLLLARDAYEIHLDELIDAATKHKKIIELNANPQRLDLDWQNLLQSPQLMTSINPDIHHLQGFEDTDLGCVMAQKGIKPSALILNTKPLSEVEAYFESIRKS